MLETTITRANTEDSEGIALIEASCFSVPWSQNGIIDFIKSDTSIVLVAKNNGTICGYIGMYHSFGEGDITNVAVLPEYRNKGIAGSLISELIDICKANDISKVRLEVRQTNTPAISLYEKFGFYKVGIRKNYYSHPKEDAVLMDLDITTAAET